MKIKKEDEAMKAIGYARISAIKKDEEGKNTDVSLEVQERRIRLYAEGEEFDLIDILKDEGVSGTKRIREHFSVVEAMVRKKEVQHVIVYDLSRLSRSVKDSIELVELFKRKGVSFHSITDRIDTSTATGKFMFHILCSVNQYVPDVTSEKTRAGLRHKKTKGQKTGGPVPYGYSYIMENDKKVLIEKASEQRIIRYMKGLRKDGYTFQAICEHLEEKGYKTKQGGNGSGRWYPKNVRAILRYKTSEMVQGNSF